jgi:rhamnosyl/mannosyltransferase
MARGALVHLHMPNPLSELSSLLLPSTTPVVASYHCDIFRQRMLMPLYKPLLVRCLNRASKVVCGSTRLRYGSPVLSEIDRDIEVIPYGIDVDRWTSARVPSAAIESLYRRYSGPFIVSVGRLVSYKGFDRLIDAAAEFPAPLVIVGDGPERVRLQNQIAASGLGERVFLAGHLSDDALLTHLAAARIFVLASVNRSEAYGIAILEAQAAGLPVVVTDVATGTREAFAPEETGVLVPSDDPRQLVEAIRRLAHDPEMGERMGAEGRRRVRALNSLDALGCRLELVYSRAEGSVAHP